MSEVAQSYRLTVAYDGTAYHGWQRQPHTATVAGCLEAALVAATGQRPPIRAAGRTDAGAHARGQVVGFSLDPGWAPEALRAACNSRLPEDVRVTGAQLAGADFDPRRQAWRRTYRYQVRTGQGRQPVGRQYAWSLPFELELAPMRGAARALLGRHDFASFGTSPVAGGSTARLLDRADIAISDSGYTFELRGDAFLRGMVRNLVGALVGVGSGRMTAEQFRSLLADARPGSAGGLSAPAQGLHLWRVEYLDLEQQGASA